MGMVNVVHVSSWCDAAPKVTSKVTDYQIACDNLPAR